jgi:serine/threonine-protein kinase
VTDLAPGSEFAGCRIEAVIGRGGMGVVYRAQDLSLGRPVAIKLVNDEYAEDTEARRRFEREARLAASIDHPNVIPIYAAGEQDGHLYLVMRYVDGTDLQTLLRTEGRLPAAEAARITDQIGRALDAAHKHGLVHRDIKPANVILSGDHAYLTDFGVTRLVDDHTQSTDTGKWVGTLDYTSPEQLRAEPTGALADVYSLGCLLYTCLSGSPPFKRSTSAATITAHLHDDPPRVSDLSGVPKQFDEVIKRALAKRPDRRYQSAGRLGAAALAAAQGRRVGPSRFGRRSRAVEPPASPAISAPPRAPVQPRRPVDEPAGQGDLPTVVRGEDKTVVRGEEKTVVRGDEPTRTRTAVMPKPATPGGAPADQTSDGHLDPRRQRKRTIAATLLLLAIVVVALVALALSRGGSKTPSGALTASEITTAVHHFATDYSHHDLHSLSGLLASDVTRVDPTSAQRGRAAVLAQYSRQFTTKPIPTGYAISSLSVTPGWAGRAQARYTLTLTGGGTLSGNVVFGVQRGRGGRAQVALISTR